MPTMIRQEKLCKICKVIIPECQEKCFSCEMKSKEEEGIFNEERKPPY